METLAQKIAEILGVSADKVALVYPDMVRAWRLDALMLMAAGTTAILIAMWLVRLGLNDDEEARFFGIAGGVLFMLAGAVTILVNISSAIYPDATFVYHLMGRIKP